MSRTRGPPAIVVDPRVRVVTAAGAASAAVIALNADLSGDDVLDDVLALDQALTPRPTGGLNPGATVTTSATDRARTPYYLF